MHFLRLYSSQRSKNAARAARRFSLRDVSSFTCRIRCML
jgi:hypothetical protein